MGPDTVQVVVVSPVCELTLIVRITYTDADLTVRTIFLHAGKKTALLSS